jgi:citronellyl-CoA synthetase
MAAFITSSEVSEFDFKGLFHLLSENLAPYAIPIFLRFKAKLSVTHTFKLKKLKLKKEGFNLEKIGDPLFVLLPDESEYKPLTQEIYENIQNQKYNF